MAELGGSLHKLPRCFLRVSGAARSALSSLGDASNVRGDLATAMRRIAHVAGDFIGGAGLLFDRTGDGVLDIVDVSDDGTYLPIASTAPLASF